MLQRNRGQVTFERYMELCLYNPLQGYYTTKEKIFGKEGDYYTSPYTHRFFSQTLAHVFACFFQQLGRPHPFHLIELGAGEGLLGREILAYLSKHHQTVWKAAEYLALEVDRFELPTRICGVVFSNEFFDALPVHRVRLRDSQLREIYVELDNDLEESEGEISDPRIVEYMQEGFERWREGYEYEVNLRLIEVLEKLDFHLESGMVLTIDYGYDWPEYDSLPRATGTLMCYDQHRAHQNPYINIGRQDITAHVNFEIMLKTGQRLGWGNQPLKTQRRFLMEWGLEEKLLGMDNVDSQSWEERLKLKTLLLPEGISDTMKVLVQSVRVTGDK